MLMNALFYLAALLGVRHPRKQLADDKRRLEALLQAEGLSRSAARRITVEFFR